MSAGSDSGDKPKNGKSGPYNPPHETRWKKGCPSPNPSGRPRKATKQKMLEQRLEPFQEMVLRAAGTKVPTKSGGSQTLQESAINKLYELAFNEKSPSFRALALLIELTGSASAAAEKMRFDAVSAATKYKEATLRQLREWDAKGIKYVEPIPHPADIVIGPGLSLRFVGPTTDQGYLVMQDHLKKREIAEQLFTLRMTEEDSAQRKKNIVFCRRHWKKHNAALPPRLQKTAMPERTLDDDDEETDGLD